MYDEKQKLSELVRRLQSGDRNAFNEIYSLTYQNVYFTALKICKNESDAEDVLQESYMYILNKIQDLQNPEAFMSWFNMVVANRAKNLLRKNNPVLFKDEETEQEIIDSVPDEDKAYQPGTDVEQDDLKQDVMKLIDGLSDDKRTAVILYYYNEMTTKQIAESLDINENTVKSRLVQAKKDLAKGVRELEKKNKSLFGVAPIPLILWALKSAAKSTAVPAAVGKIAASTAAASTAGATAAAAAKTGGIGAKIASWSVGKRVVAGVVAASMVAGGAVGTKLIIDALNADQVVEEVYYDGTCGENAKWTLEKNSGSLRIYGAGSVSDDESIRKYLDDGKVKDVVIEDGITKLETNLFSKTDIESVVIPASITEMAGWDFTDCKKLEKVKFKKRTAEQTLVIKKCLCNGCESLTDINFEDSNAINVYEAHEGYRFEGCTSLKEITIPKTLDVIEYCDFNECTSLETVNVPAEVNRIDPHAFNDCSSLKNVNFEQNSQLEAVGNWAFRGCTSLESITLPGSVKTLDTGMFGHCTSLKSFSFDNLSVNEIPSQAFLNCTSLETFVIPSHIEIIGPNAFKGCTQLKSVVFEKRNPQQLLQIPFVPLGGGCNVFEGCTALESINLEESNVTEIGDYCFSGCVSLKTVIIPNTCRVLGNGVFSGCENLEKADIPSSVTSIGDDVFMHCPKINGNSEN